MKDNQKRKLFITKLKDYQTQNKGITDYVNQKHIDSEGFAIIDIDLSDTPLYRNMSYGKQLELNPEIFTYLDDKVYFIPIERPIKLRISGVSEPDRQVVSRLIKEHYNLKLNDKKADLKENSVKSLSLFVIGALLLALYFVLGNYSVNLVWYEIFSIVATFIIWESADFFILERRSIRVAYYDTAQMVFADIVFIDEKIDFANNDNSFGV